MWHCKTETTKSVKRYSMSLCTYHWVSLFYFGKGVLFSWWINHFSVLLTILSWEEWKCLIWARTTYNTVPKAIDSYLLCFCGAKIRRYIFISNELVHVCWILMHCIMFLEYPWSDFLPPPGYLNSGREARESSLAYVAPLIWQLYWMLIGYLKGLLASRLDDQDCEFELMSFGVTNIIHKTFTEVAIDLCSLI